MSTLKFDRERFDAGEMPTRTRNGRKVLHVHDSGLDVELPIAAWLEGLSWPAFFYQPDGRYTSIDVHDLDLVHEPKMRKLRIVVCRNPLSGGVSVVPSDNMPAKAFDEYVAARREDGKLLHLLEVEVPE